MRNFEYEAPAITFLGNVSDLTRGNASADADGQSGMSGNQSNSDDTGGGANDGN